MRLERKKNTKRNIYFGFINKTVTILFPFVIRTVLIHELGAKYLGLSSLFTSVLQVLSLSELGIGSAMVFHMYKPIAEDDEARIRSLVNSYKYIYRIIGSIILISGLLVMPFLKNFISGNIPADSNIYILFFIYLINSSESYFISAYKSTILNAFQRKDVILNIGLFAHIFLYLTQIYCLIKFHNYYLYIIWLPICTCIQNVLQAIYIKKHYPAYIEPCKPNFVEIRKVFANVRDLFGHKLSQVVTVSVDTIVISTFLGLQMVTIYNNYYYIMFAIIGFIEIAFQAILAGIGNSIAIETRKKNYCDFICFVQINAWVIGWCSICFICLYQPAMTLWMGKGLLLSSSTVVLIVIYFYIWRIRQAVLLYKDAAGMWKIDRIKPYVEIIVNITLNIILVQMIGINGVVISTIISMLFISLPWETYVFFKIYFQRSTKRYYINILFDVLITILLCLITFSICNLISGITVYSILIKLCTCIFVPNLIIIIIFHRNKQFKELLHQFFNILKLKR